MFDAVVGTIGRTGGAIPTPRPIPLANGVRHVTDYFAIRTAQMNAEGRQDELLEMLRTMQQTLMEHGIGEGRKEAARTIQINRWVSLTSILVGLIAILGLVYQAGAAGQRLSYLEQQVQSNISTATAVTELKVQMQQIQEELKLDRQAIERQGIRR